MTLVFSRNERLASHTTFRMGGIAKGFITCTSTEELRGTFRQAKEEKLPVLILGSGSNVLVGEGGIESIVVKMATDGVAYHEADEGVVVVAAAGVLWDNLVKETVEEGLWGLENLSGIPGTVGAAPIQNIGAYGKEVASIIEWVEVFDPIAENIKRLSPTACMFGYRESLFKKPLGVSLVVTRVAFRLSRKGVPQLGYKDFVQFPELVDAAEPLSVREAVLAIRAGKFPSLTDTSLGTAGSFFKNPFVTASHAEELAKRFSGLPIFDTATGMKKLSAAWLIDHVAHMRGVRDGFVGTYQGQALVIVSAHGASASDVLRFAQTIRTGVYERTHVMLEPEVRMIACALSDA